MELLTLAEVAGILKVSVKTVRREIASRRLTPTPIRGAVRINRADLEYYLECQRKEKPPEKPRGADGKPREIKGGFRFVGA